MLRRSTVFSVAVLVLILIVGGILATRIDAFDKREKQMATQTTVQTATSPAEFSLPTTIQSISISDNSPASIWWIPNDQKFVLSQIIAWLKQAEPYTEKIPQSPEVVFQGNVGPAQITLTTSDKRLLVIYPAYYIEKSEKTHTSISTDEHGVVTKTENPEFQVQYVQDVLVFDNGGDRSYLKSEELYNWLKSNQWKTEFTRRDR